jgi:hypothetical protein
MSYLAIPAAPAVSSRARAPRAAAPVPRPVAGAAVGAAGVRPAPGPAPLSATDPCVSPAAVATFAAWPTVATATTDDDDEVRGERRPDVLAVPAAFRAVQACRVRTGG